MPAIYPQSFGGWFFAAVRIVAAIYIFALIALFFFQEKLIFLPDKLSPEFKFEKPLEEKILDVDGHKISSILLKTNPSKGVVLYFHGNAGNLEGWGEVAEELAARTGWNIWMIDYPGYGKSEGSISSEKQLSDIADALWTAAEKEYPSAPKVIYGRSIGTGIASNLATKHSAAGLILESPYLNLPKLANDILPFAPTFLLKYRFANDEAIRKISYPVLLIQGTKDEVIPIRHGRALAKIDPRAKLVEVPEGHHNDLAAFPEYWKALKQIL